jgi:hypothetical protein
LKLEYGCFEGGLHNVFRAGTRTIYDHNFRGFLRLR